MLCSDIVICSTVPVAIITLFVTGNQRIKNRTFKFSLNFYFTQIGLFLVILFLLK